MARAKKEGDLYLASNVDVRRGESKDGTPKIETIRGGQMVSDTDLKAEEIKDLTARGLVRVPTKEESDAVDAQAEAGEGAAAASEAEVNARILEQSQANERARLESEQSAGAAEAAAKLAEKQEKERLAAAKGKK